MLIKVNVICRKPRNQNFSLEKLFSGFNSYFSNSETIEYNIVHLPFYSNGVLNRILNGFYCFFLRGDVFHISGDIHYVALFTPTKKTILTIHDCGANHKRNKLKQAIYKLVWFKLPCLFSGSIIAISDFTKHELVEKYNIDSKEISVIENYYDPEIDKFSAGINFCRNDFNIVLIGTKSNKNLERTVKAISNVNSRIDSVSINVSIVGSLSQEQLNLIETMNFNYSCFINLSDQELYELYEKSDLLSFVSTFEGFGMPIIEANAIGLPVITSNIDPMKHVAGEGAVLVDPYDIIEIEKGILKIIDDTKLAKKLSTLGRINSQRFTIESISDEYLSLYKKVSKRGGL